MRRRIAIAALMSCCATAFADPSRMVLSRPISLAEFKSPTEAQAAVREAGAMGFNTIDLQVPLDDKIGESSVSAAIVEGHRLGLIVNVEICAAEVTAAALIKLAALEIDGVVVNRSIATPVALEADLLTQAKAVAATDAIVAQVLRGIREANPDVAVSFRPASEALAGLAWNDWPAWCCDRPNWDAFYVTPLTQEVVARVRPGAAILCVDAAGDVPGAIDAARRDKLAGVCISGALKTVVPHGGESPLYPSGWREPAIALQRVGREFKGEVKRAATYAVVAKREGVWSIEKTVELPVGDAVIACDAEAACLIVQR